MFAAAIRLISRFVEFTLCKGINLSEPEGKLESLHEEFKGRYGFVQSG